MIDDEVSLGVQRVASSESVLHVGEDADVPVVSAQEQSVGLLLESSKVEETNFEEHEDVPLTGTVTGSPPPSKLASKRVCSSRKSKPRSRSRSPLRDEATHRLSPSPC